MDLIKKWFFNSRGYSFPQNVMPSVLAIVLALGAAGFNSWLALLALVGVCLAHLGGNLLDDYFDYQDELLDYRIKLRRQGKRPTPPSIPI